MPPESAAEYARRCAREEDVLVGVSSGAALAAVAQKLPERRGPMAASAGAGTTGMTATTGMNSRIVTSGDPQGTIGVELERPPGHLPHVAVRVGEVPGVPAP